MTFTKDQLMAFVEKRKNQETIDLPNKGIEEIPEGLFDNCPNLEWLFLNHNQIQALPPTFLDQCPNLTGLYLDNNQIQALPPTFLERCPNLKWLYLDNNQIQALPPKFLGQCPNLEKLNLNNNQIQALPPTFLGQCPKLEWLWLYNNPLRSISLPSHLDGIELRVNHNIQVTYYEPRGRRSPRNSPRSPRNQPASPSSPQPRQRSPPRPRSPRNQPSSPYQAPGQPFDVECLDDIDILGIDDFTKGHKEYKVDGRVMILGEGNTRKGTCMGQYALIKSMLALGGEEGNVPTMGPWPSKTHRYFKLPHTNQWVDADGFNLVLQGHKILRMKFLREEKIGSEIGVGTLHGSKEKIFTLVKVRSKYQGMNTAQLHGELSKEGEVLLWADANFLKLF